MPAKHVKQKKHIENQQIINNKEWPAVVYLWMFGLAFFGYLIAESIFRTAWTHPMHWLSALVGGVLGIGAGWLWYRWRGDVL